jgi:hypothetical protein
MYIQFQSATTPRDSLDVGERTCVTKAATLQHVFSSLRQHIRERDTFHDNELGGGGNNTVKKAGTEREREEGVSGDSQIGSKPLTINARKFYFFSC